MQTRTAPAGGRYRQLQTVLALGVLVPLLAACLGGRSFSPSATVLDKPLTSAPDFTLPETDGRPFALRDARGKVVVLTFLYTHCPDECPLIASKLHAVSEQLGPAATQTVIVAVSVDPAGDTPASVAQFTAEHQMQSRWRYLVGSQAQLAPVWNAYFIGAEAAPTPRATAEERATPTAAVSHAAVVYLIDRSGIERAAYDADLAPADLAHDVRLLLGG